ncbi:MAG: hypothetical protein R2684_08525 [Pyrinomonadaceae bacterium]
MPDQIRNNLQNGYTVVNSVISEDDRDRVVGLLPQIDNSGSRTLLRLEPFCDLARDLRAGVLSGFLEDLVAVECILFRKTSEHNWSVGLHRDEVLPVKGSGDWPSAGVKEGMTCARPTREIMDQCLAVRVHLDGAPIEDISVVPGSHLDDERHERISALPIAVPQCGALIMRPRLAHASSKLGEDQKRRVLHFVFAPPVLPEGYSWYFPV